MPPDETIWSDEEFTGRDFRDDDLSLLRTERVVFDECDFRGVDLTESEHAGSAFRNCRFERATLHHSTFRQCSMLGSVFTGARLRPLTLVDVDLTLAVLGGCDMRGVDLAGCRMQNLRLDDADLRGARTDASLWTTASVKGAKIAVDQALAYAAAHGLNIHGE